MRWRKQIIRLTISERITLYERLALYLRSGIPITQSLGLMRDAASQRRATAALAHLMQNVSEGVSLSMSLKSPVVRFPLFETHLTGLGEHAGTLPDSLAHLAMLLRRQRELTRTILQALAYPAVIVAGTLAVSIFLIAFVFPKIVPIFKGLHIPLPLTTRLLIALSDFVGTFWHLLLAGFLASGIAAYFLCRRPEVRALLSRIALRMPVLGPLLRAYILAMLARTLANLLASGIALVPAMALASDSARSEPYRRALVRVETAIRQGQRLSAELAAFPQLFPSDFVQLIAAGETTGSLPASLRTMAERYEDELNGRTRALTALIEPVLMLGMGLVVGFVAIAIISPIYGISQNLSGPTNL